MSSSVSPSRACTRMREHALCAMYACTPNTHAVMHAVMHARSHACERGHGVVRCTAPQAARMAIRYDVLATPVAGAMGMDLGTEMCEVWCHDDDG